MSATPLLRKSRGISPIWLLPLLALSICAWLLYQSQLNAGVDIEIYFADASGLVAGKTLVMAKGIRVGIVKKVSLDLASNKIKAVVRMDRETVPYLVEDTIFWIVRPELTAARVEGLDTIFSGSYIDIQPGSSTTKRLVFDGAASAPPVAASVPGLHITLKAEALGSIQKGTGVYYRNIEIGSVQSIKLDGEEGVTIGVYIEEEYRSLVHDSSRFCNVSGINIGGSLSDIKVHIESLASLLRGGILLYTPKELLDTPSAENGSEFTLYEDFEAAEFGLHLEIKFPSGSDLVEKSTKLMFKGVELGVVNKIDIHHNREESGGYVIAHILLDPRAENLLREGTQFWMVEPEVSLTGLKNLQTILSGSYITFSPGSDENAPFKNRFEILPVPPAMAPLRNGKSFFLISEDADVTKGAPVYFKSVQVGEVVDVQLRKVGREVETRIYIFEEYLNLLSSDTVFWKYSGVKFKADFSGVALDMSPLTKLMAGGVGFTSPHKMERKKNTPPTEGQRFTLYASYQDAVDATPAIQPKGKFFQIYADAGTTLHVGSPINHKNVTIGKVLGFELVDGVRAVLVDCFVEEKYARLVNPRTRFYDTSGVNIIGNLKSFELNTGSLQSIVTGGVSCFTNREGKPLKRGKPYPLYSSFRDAVNADLQLITVYFSDIEGLQKNAPLLYHGIKVGEVVSLELGKDLATASAKIRVDDEVRPLFRRGTKIWLQQAEIGLSKISNLQSIVFGPSLRFLPGKGQPETSFTAVKTPPVQSLVKGFTAILEAKQRGSLVVGSPVYYRQVQVGEVVACNLSQSFKSVDVHIVIRDEYRTLIRENTHFWNVSGITFSAGLFSGIDVHTESLEAIMAGGIAFATPEKDAGKPVKEGSRFQLYNESKEAWLDWSPDLRQ